MIWDALVRRFGLPMLVRLMNAYPPFVGANIRVRYVGPGHVVSSMRLRSTNQNMMGTHFGGSLYAMCDPFFVVLLADALGKEYMVWDKAAAVRFLKPGVGKVEASFVITQEEVARVREAVTRDRKTEPVYQARVVSESGEVIAEVDKTLYVRKRLRGVSPARRG